MYKKSKEPKINYFNNNLLKVSKNNNIFYLNEKKENTLYNNYCKKDIYKENLGNIIYIKNKNNFNNSGKINKGVLLLQNLINKNYEEIFYNTNSSIESELISNYSNNYNEKEEKQKNKTYNNLNNERTKKKNNINYSKLKKIFTTFENKKNKILLKKYFTNFRSLLNNKIKKQLIVRKTDVIREVKKRMPRIVNKNSPIFLENKSTLTSNISEFKKELELISPLSFDKITNEDNSKENIEKTGISNIKLENDSNDLPSIFIHSIPKFNSSKDTSELIKNEDELLNLKYYKYQDFILSFRLLLIFYSLNKSSLC